MDFLARVRAACLALPEATEKEAWGSPTFRVRDKLFAMFADHHHGVEHVALWIKAAPGIQESVVPANPKHFFIPPYVGKQGWIGIKLDTNPDWKMVERFLADGYRLLAPKRALAALEGEAKPAPARASRARPAPPSRGRPRAKARRRKASP